MAELRLSLGSLYNITIITLQKKVGDQFIDIQTRQNISALQLDFSDLNLIPGINTYRIRINLAGGGVAYSSIESLFYFRDGDYVIYPNPALQNETINIAQFSVDDAVMQVFNATGIKVFEKLLDDRVNTIPPNTLSKGVHFIRVIKNNKPDKSLKLIVL